MLRELRHAPAVALTRGLALSGRARRLRLQAEGQLLGDWRLSVQNARIPAPRPRTTVHGMKRGASSSGWQGSADRCASAPSTLCPLMIIDSHAHCTKPPRPDRPRDGEIAATNPELLASDWLTVEDLLARAAGADVERIVRVTKTQMGSDNRCSLEGTKRFPGQVSGVMGRFDPLAPQLGRTCSTDAVAVSSTMSPRSPIPLSTRESSSGRSRNG